MVSTRKTRQMPMPLIAPPPRPMYQKRNRTERRQEQIVELLQAIGKLKTNRQIEKQRRINREKAMVSKNRKNEAAERMRMLVRIKKKFQKMATGARKGETKGKKGTYLTSFNTLKTIHDIVMRAPFDGKRGKNARGKLEGHIKVYDDTRREKQRDTRKKYMAKKQALKKMTAQVINNQ